MSSTFLYLAIVAVWAVVLVPMWLRRDTEAPAFSRILHRRPALADSHVDDHAGEDVRAEDETAEAEMFAEPPADVAPTRVRRGRSRGAVIARRRRRTSGLLALVLASAGAVLGGLGPWWAVLPPIVLLTGHLSLLRVAVGMDAVRRREAEEARLAARRRARAREEARRRAEEEAVHAKIIDLAGRARARDVFDQYAQDGLRAVGD